MRMSIFNLNNNDTYKDEYIKSLGTELELPSKYND